MTGWMGDFIDNDFKVDLDAGLVKVLDDALDAFCLTEYVRWQSTQNAVTTDRLLQYLEKDGERRERAIKAQGEVSERLEAVATLLRDLVTDEHQERELLRQLTETVGRVCAREK